MRLLLVHNFYQQPGGEDEVFAAESRLLEAHGHSVRRHTVHNASLQRAGRLSLAARTLWSRSSYQELREICSTFRPDVVHFHNTLPLISPAGYYAARAGGAAVVQTLHNYRLVCPGGLLFRAGRVCEDCIGRAVPIAGVAHGCYRGSIAASAAVAAMISTHRAAGTWARMVDAYIACTEFGRSKFAAGGIPVEKIIVKPHFVDPDPGSGDHRGDFALFVGRLAPEKGVSTLLRAWSLTRPGIPLRVAGSGPLSSLVNDAASGVEWLGRCNRDSITALMQNATFLISPSESYETFGLTHIEAFATGLPVIASRLGAMAELVEDGVTGLHFNPGDAADLAAKVAWALENPRAMRSMGRTARSVYERHFTAERNYQMLLHVYRTAMQRVEGGVASKRTTAARS